MGARKDTEPTPKSIQQGQEKGGKGKGEEEGGNGKNGKGKKGAEAAAEDKQAAAPRKDTELTPKSIQQGQEKGGKGKGKGKGEEEGGKGKNGKGKKGAEAAAEDKQAAAPRKDTELTPKSIQQGQEKGG